MPSQSELHFETESAMDAVQSPQEMVIGNTWENLQKSNGWR